MIDDTPHRSNLNLLFVLDAILSTTSLKDAAARINLSPSAVSMALKKARHHYSDELVIEIEGRRRLTALAIALQPRIRQTLMDGVHVLGLKLDFDPAITRSIIRISMPDFVEVLFLPHVLRAMRARAPGVELQLVPFDYRPTTRHFDREIDFVILPGRLVNTSFGYAKLYIEQLGVMVGRSHPLAKTDEITVADYCAGAHAALFDEADMLAPKVGPIADILARRMVVARTASYAAMPLMVIDTDLMVTASLRYGQYCASIMDLAALAFPVPVDDVEIAVQWHPSRGKEPMIRWFVGLMQEMVTSI